jgi:hypothetical protein
MRGARNKQKKTWLSSLLKEGREIFPTQQKKKTIMQILKLEEN